MRLIDADKVIIPSEEYCARMAIQNALTVDAVEVVRCKDCKHKRDSKNAFDWDGVTPLCVCGYSTMVNRGYEYCSWGERKTD